MPVFLFPGQGAQFSGMGMDLHEADKDGSVGVRGLFELASSILGKDIKDLLTAEADVLKRTDISQVAITVASLAAWKTLAAKGIRPTACAGFSLGEYPALAVAGVLSEADVIRVTAERGRVMQKACADIARISNSAEDSGASSPGMSAVLGLSPERIDEVIRDSRIPDLYAANYNSPLQTVISGTAEALDAAAPLFKEAGARRCIRLGVAGPFHSPLMKIAARDFSEFLTGIDFQEPKIPLFSNVTGGRVRDRAEIKALAVSHLVNPVKWTTEEASVADWMTESGMFDTPTKFDGDTGHDNLLVEVGPGRVLSGLWADSGLRGTCKPYTEFLQ